MKSVKGISVRSQTFFENLQCESHYVYLVLRGKKSYNFACPLGAREIKESSWYNGVCNTYKLNSTKISKEFSCQRRFFERGSLLAGP